MFTPKFVESQFSISAGWAAQLVGKQLLYNIYIYSLTEPMHNRFEVTKVHKITLELANDRDCVFVYLGFATIPAGGGGTFVGGYLVKRLNLNIPGILKMCLITSATALVLTLGFLVHCDNVSFAGVNVHYSFLNV